MYDVTVIIPVFNRAHLIERSLQSVAKQTYAGIHVLVVDDGSTDGLELTINRLKMDPIYRQIEFIQQINLGVSAARNAAIKQTKTDWIALLDSDDEWHPDKIAKQMEYVKNHPGIRLIHTDEIWYRNGKLLNQKAKHKKQGGRIFLNCLPLCCISPSASLIHRSVFTDIGFFDETFPVCEDYDMWLRICAREEVGFIPESLTIKHGGHDDQLSHRFKAMDYWRVRALHKIWQSRLVSGFEFAELNREILRKCEILQKGYRKYHNPLASDEIQKIQLQLS